jgi:hypothetical protein
MCTIPYSMLVSFEMVSLSLISKSSENEIEVQSVNNALEVGMY